MAGGAHGDLPSRGRWHGGRWLTGAVHHTDCLPLGGCALPTHLRPGSGGPPPPRPWLPGPWWQGGAVKEGGGHRGAPGIGGEGGAAGPTCQLGRQHTPARRRGAPTCRAGRWAAGWEDEGRAEVAASRGLWWPHAFWEGHAHEPQLMQALCSTACRQTPSCVAIIATASLRPTRAP